MAGPTAGTSIQEFLYAFASGEADQAGEGDGWAPMMTWVRADEALESTVNSMSARRLGPSPSRPSLTGARLRAEVERHNDRTMTVVSLNETWTITRCGVCPKEANRPCTALRVLALPYAQHPAYRPEWAVEQHAVVPAPRRESGHLGGRSSDAPGEELAPRGTAVESTVGVRAN